MRIFLLPGAMLGLALSVASPANAQMYPGQDVSVNPAAMGGPAYYPGGLLPPGARSRALPPVHLHPPRERTRYRRAERRRPKRTETARKAPKPAPEQAVEIAPAPTRPAPVRTKPKAVAQKPAAKKVARTAPPPASAIPFSFGGPSAPPASPPKSAPSAKHTASKAPLPKITLQKGLSKQAAILFDSGSADLSDRSSARLNDLAFSLKTALANGASIVELIAYAGNPGDKSSAARRLSLRRAIAVREQLVTDGVPPARIDVRAMGGVNVDDNGATDRVDIFVKA